MMPTGRTESLQLKVSRVIKEFIDSKRKNEGFNMSEWFEDKFSAHFLSSIPKLMEERKKSEEELRLIDLRISEMKNLEQREQLMSLTDVEKSKLVVSCNNDRTDKQQYIMFKEACKKKGLSFDDFKIIKGKYMRRMMW